MMLFLIGTVFLAGCVIAYLLAKKEKQNPDLEVGRFVLTAAGVFLGVLLAAQFSELSQSQQEKDFSKRLIRASVVELNGFKKRILEIPIRIREIRASGNPIEVESFMKSNPLSLPQIVSTTLSDPNLFKRMSDAGILNIYTARDNAQRTLDLMNQSALSDKKLTEVTRFSASAVQDLIRFMEFEYKYQNGQLSQEGVKRFHDRYIEEEAIGAS